MQEQTQEQVQEQTTDNGNQIYLDEIDRLKKNTVSKDAYAKLQEDNKRLLNAVVNNAYEEQQDSAEKVADLKPLSQLRQELFHPEKDLTNLEYAEKTIELRERVLAEEGKDIFVAQGYGIQDTVGAHQSAEKTAEALKHCIEYADGNSEVFTNELMRITKDINLPRR